MDKKEKEWYSLLSTSTIFIWPPWKMRALDFFLSFLVGVKRGSEPQRWVQKCIHCILMHILTQVRRRPYDISVCIPNIEITIAVIHINICIICESRMDVYFQKPSMYMIHCTSSHPWWATYGHLKCKIRSHLRHCSYKLLSCLAIASILRNFSPIFQSLEKPIFDNYKC